MPPKPFEIYRRLLREGWQDVGGREGWHDDGCKGSHRKLSKDGTRIILPMHRGEMAKGMWEDVRKRAGWR